MAPRLHVFTHLVADPFLRELQIREQIREQMIEATQPWPLDLSETITIQQLAATQPLPSDAQLLVVTQPLPPDVQAPPPAVQVPPLLAARKRPRERLEELEDLKNLLTDAEYQSKRAEIIASV